MKKILSTILPSLLIFIFIFIDSHFPYSKNILLGIYILFPILFIIQGIISSNSIKTMLSGFLLSSIAIILPINEWYKMGSMIPAIIVYLLLGIISFLLLKAVNSIKSYLKNNK